VSIASLLIAEFCARTFFGLEPLRHARTYQPLFVSGDFYNTLSHRELVNVPGGPVSLGYKDGGEGFFFDPGTKPPRTSTSFADFLFAHALSRYSAEDVDRISCEEKEATLVWVLGGSLAQGFSAMRKEETWHARLETMLRDQLRRRDLYVFNAAMGAFVSLQEKLAYHLAVVPRRADLVLIVDGYNDLIVPANFSVRPGDPYQVGMRFNLFFSDGFLWWAARHSAILRTMLQNRINRHVADVRRRLDRDDALFEQYAEAIADIYVENMTEVLDSCAARGQTCLVGVQPARTLTAEYVGARVDDVLSQKRIVELYRTLLATVAASPRSDRFIDFTHVFDHGEKLRYFADSVHPTASGQEVFARAMLPHVLAGLKSAQPVAGGFNRCKRLR